MGKKAVPRQLGEKIKSYRKSQRLSQFKLAEAIGINPKYLSRIEVGEAYPSLKTLEKIAVALKVPIKNLFDFSSNQLEKSSSCPNCLLSDNYIETLDDASKNKLQALVVLITKLLK